MSSAEHSALRAEIKAWERSFKEQNGHPPTVQDIKDNPPIGAPTTCLTISATRTPLQDPYCLDLPAKHAPTLSAPLQSFNPFSPQKDRTRALPETETNALASPTRTTRQNHVFPSASPSLQATPPRAISRARKRLRGDPVTPSPDKRRRLSTPPGPYVICSFLDDSPVKPSTSKKAFALFDDTSGGSNFPLKNPHGVRNSKSRAGNDPAFSSRLAAPHNLSGRSKLTQDVDMDASDVATASSSTIVDSDSTPVLIPPSPPPEPTFQAKSYKGKGKAGGSGKGNGKTPSAAFKDEYDNEDDMGASSSFDFPVQIIRSSRRTRVRKVQSDTDEDGGDVSSFHPISNPTHWDVHTDRSELDVDVPDELLDVLNLTSTRPTSYDRQEEDEAAHRLVYGRARIHYDPTKGGEIWGAGDYDVNDLDDLSSRTLGRGEEEEDDEWEGEGVPWEKAEM
ncbi:hypothetical protein DL96DRAFT_1702750 [Flagelloscypha sp. PMI_526]|nr:hypothetical protein DL96DRAFT_1702750 [Flagelloscypha sp. PMI_526]